MPLLINNPNLNGTAGNDIIAPFAGNGTPHIVSGGGGNDAIIGTRLPYFSSIGGSNQTYNTALSVDDPARWVNLVQNPLVGDINNPSTTIYAEAPQGGYACYSVTLGAGAVLTVDIDFAQFSIPGFDSFIEILSATTGEVLAVIDDSSNVGQGGYGSTNTTDSYGQFTASAAGLYVVRVGRFQSITSSLPLQPGDMFVLNLTATNHAHSAAGTAGISTFHGDGGADYLVGYTGSDSLYGDADNDRLFGSLGDDTLYGGAGDDMLDGGFGTDEASYIDVTSAVSVDLAIAGAQNTGGGGTDTLTDMEGLSGSLYNDTLSGNDADNALYGNSGHDTLNGRGGDDYIVVGLGSDTVNGGAGTDTMQIGHSGVDWVVNAITGVATSSLGSVSFTSIENIFSSGGNDTIRSDGSGTFRAGAGNDLIYAALGTAETLDGSVGVDTLDTTSATFDYVINLATGLTNYGGESFIGFENLIAGDGNNTITGSTAANDIRSGSGNDWIAGGDGDDIIEGRLGNDTLNGEVGYDFVSYANATAGVTVSLLNQGVFQPTGSAGSDSLNGFEAILGSAFNDTLTGDNAVNTLRGGLGNDTLNGGIGNDVIVWREGDGNDTIDGGASTGSLGDLLDLRGAASGWTVDIQTGTATNGTATLALASMESVDGSDYADTLTGRVNGGSTLLGWGGDDYIKIGLNTPNNADGGSGVDTLDTTAFNTLNSQYGINLVTGLTSFSEVIANFENLISGDTADTVTGTTAANNLVTRGGNDTIRAGAGNDRVEAGEGNDVVEGGAGDDRLDGGNGVDTADYAGATAGVVVRLALTGDQNTVGAGIDRLIGFENLTGSAFADALAGTTGANRLDGGVGADTLEGGKGDDVYVVDNSADKVLEKDGEGSDTINSTATFSLAGQFVEVINLLGDAAINATGNGLANRLVGNSANNVLFGMTGNDRLDGGEGADTMRGGLGNDVFVVDNVGDAVQEADGEGLDTVEAWISYSLAGQYIESLKLMGSGNINATGNGQVNELIGNAGDNLLNGMGGVDTMRGGAGDDFYIVDNAGDGVFENNEIGFDIVQSSVTYSIAGQYIEELRLTGSAAINGTGNSFANWISGNTGANTLNGGGGNDELHGGLGNDILIGGAGQDRFWFDTSASASNFDTISDFNIADDSIYLSTAVFSAIGAGVLSTGAFRPGAAAVDADDRILYDAATGNIRYDYDGNGGGAAVLVAKVAAGLALTNADFVGAVP